MTPSCNFVNKKLAQWLLKDLQPKLLKKLLAAEAEAEG